MDVLEVYHASHKTLLYVYIQVHKTWVFVWSLSLTRSQCGACC